MRVMCFLWDHKGFLRRERASFSWAICSLWQGQTMQSVSKPLEVLQVCKVVLLFFRQTFGAWVYCGMLCCVGFFLLMLPV